MTHPRVILGLLLAWLTLAPSVAVHAAMPTPEKIAQAVAEANQVSGRAAPLLMTVRLRIRDAESSAEGLLAAHPTGLARLELRNHEGFVERHLLQGDSYQASRDGQLLRTPHPFLPPIFLLQASSGAALEAALSSFGVAEQEVVLGKMGAHDCYVFGGRLIGGDSDEEQLLPSLWVDIQSYDPVHIVRADGVEYRFGPISVFGGIRVPEWIEIRTPDDWRARLEVVQVEPANAPAAAFQSDWLTAPPSRPTP